MKGCFSSDLCNVLLFRGYSQHLERPKPASLPVIATSLLAIPAAPQSLLLEKEQLCPPSQPRAPFLSLVPAVALTESLELTENQSSNLLWKTSPHLPRTHWFSMRSGAWRQGCIFLQHFRLKSAQTLWVFLYASEMVKLSLFLRALLKARKRWQHQERLQAPCGQSQPWETAAWMVKQYVI